MSQQSEVNKAIGRRVAALLDLKPIKGETDIFDTARGIKNLNGLGATIRSIVESTCSTGQ
jgi:hypothetical protein